MRKNPTRNKLLDDIDICLETKRNSVYVFGPDAELNHPGQISGVITFWQLDEVFHEVPKRNRGRSLASILQELDMSDSIGRYLVMDMLCLSRFCLYAVCFLRFQPSHA